MPLRRTVLLLVGLLVLGFIAKGTLVPFPAFPYNWDAVGAGATLLLVGTLPLLSPKLRTRLSSSPLLVLGKARLMGSAPQLRNRHGPVS